MKRALIMMPDSFGIGATEDVERFGDVGADTLGHVAEACTKGEAGNGRKGPLNPPNLTRPGLVEAHEGSTSFIPARMDSNAEAIGAYAWAYEMSSGKDTPFGHWEITGVPVLFEWGCFSDHENNLPQELLDELVKRANLPGYLGNCHSSGTVILDQLGEEHMKTGKPIFYISADPVFQIARHEEIFSLDKLYELCEIAREELTNGGHNIGRVIIRPFIGDKADSFQRTDNRHDLVVEPPAPTALQKLVDEKHGQVVSVGKIADIYANCGIAKEVKATGLDTLFDATIKEMREAGGNIIVSINFTNFDSFWDHRRDVAGYTAGLELFGHRLPEPMSLLCDDDILIPIVDHGCDPTWTGTDYTREHILVLVYGPKAKPDSLGRRETFVDIGQALVKYFSTSGMEYGKVMF